MVFSSELFLYGFMPIFFSLYYLIADRRKNWLILIASLVFYGIGAGSTVLVLLVSIFVNQFLALRIEPAPPARRKALLAIGVAVNLFGLGYYKYATFLWQLAGGAVDALGWHALQTAPAIPLPIGISFFTFQAISYVVDVYRREIACAAQLRRITSPIHSLFSAVHRRPDRALPRVAPQMPQRRIGRTMLTEGVCRFCLGLGKKMVIADNLGTVRPTRPSRCRPLSFPAGRVARPHRLHAANLFRFLRLFGHGDRARPNARVSLSGKLRLALPLGAIIREFWRRWHMTLSRWFRDYVYIPLGGNRHGRLRTFVNLWLVFFLCGLWHGAGLTFIAWGLYHGLLLILERFAHTRWNWRPSGVFGVALSFILLLIGWVLFRSPTLATAGHYLAAMALFGPPAGGIVAALSGLTPDVMFYLALGTFFAFAPLDRLARFRFDSPAVMASQLTLSSLSLVYSSLLLAANSFNPFIYFRF